METKEIFETLLNNLKVGDTAPTVKSRRERIAKSLNREFLGKEDSTANTMMVGSYGRHTAIKGISDLDMLYFLPEALNSDYKTSETGPSRALNRVRDALKETYPGTEIKVDQCVVSLQFASNKFRFEVQPVFCNSDGSFSYPDTISKTWKSTKPRQEIEATQECNQRTSQNMRHLARMIRAWRNHVNLPMGGLLIDTLVYRFFELTNTYDSAETSGFDEMARDFFDFLQNQPPKQSYYLALGSKQQVGVKAKFQAKAKKAYNASVDAIETDNENKALEEWRKVFGPTLPNKSKKTTHSFTNTEEFIEQQYPVDIRESVTLDCDITQDGWRTHSLREMLRTKSFLKPKKQLFFHITSCTAQKPYEVKWKVLNRGSEAERRNRIRGQIISSNHSHSHKETTQFSGNHLVECYIIQNNVVIARDRILVPIGT